VKCGVVFGLVKHWPFSDLIW